MHAETDLTPMSSQVRSPAAYFEFPREGRQPFWRRSLFALSVVGLHLMGLFLAFGSLMPRTLPEFLPVLSVRVLDTLPVPPRGEDAPPKRIERTKPSPVIRVPQPKTLSTPRPVSTPAATAAAMSTLVAPPQPAARLVESLEPPALAAAPALVAARFDADYLHNPRPAYPAASRRLGEEGRVLLRVLVSTQGVPVAVDIKQSSGFSRLDEAARTAVERWRFVPARRGVEAVESSVLVPLQFSLES